MGIDSRYLDRAVKKLLSQKLGVQKTSNHNIIAKLSYLEEGVVRHDNLPETDTRRVEDTKMYNADVLIDDVKIFPDQTKDYSKIWWATVGDFLNMMDGKDVTKVGISAFDAIRGICAQGLCLSSTEENLRRKLF